MALELFPGSGRAPLRHSLVAGETPTVSGIASPAARSPASCSLSGSRALHHVFRLFSCIIPAPALQMAVIPTLRSCPNACPQTRSSHPMTSLHPALSCPENAIGPTLAPDTSVGDRNFGPCCFGDVQRPRGLASAARFILFTRHQLMEHQRFRFSCRSDRPEVRGDPVGGGRSRSPPRAFAAALTH